MSMYSKSLESTIIKTAKPNLSKKTASKASKSVIRYCYFGLQVSVTVRNKMIHGPFTRFLYRIILQRTCSLENTSMKHRINLMDFQNILVSHIIHSLLTKESFQRALIDPTRQEDLKASQLTHNNMTPCVAAVAENEKSLSSQSPFIITLFKK